jgi:hypothetical protein
MLGQLQQMPVSREQIAENVIEALAYDEARLRERVRDLESEVRGYHEVLCAAVSALREMSLERDRLRERIRDLVSELRRVRGGVTPVTRTDRGRAA